MHGACRQFFDAAEACVEPGGGGGSNTASLPPSRGLPVGWRAAVNRAGVVQVCVWVGFAWGRGLS